MIAPYRATSTTSTGSAVPQPGAEQPLSKVEASSANGINASQAKPKAPIPVTIRMHTHCP